MKVWFRAILYTFTLSYTLLLNLKHFYTVSTLLYYLKHFYTILNTFIAIFAFL